MANNYGTNLNSFSEGLMTGYNFVDAIFDRRQQAKDRQRALELENERVTMAKETHKANMEGIVRTRKREDDQDFRDLESRVGGELSDAALKAGGVDKLDDATVLAGYRRIKPDATLEEARAQTSRLVSIGSDVWDEKAAGELAVSERKDQFTKLRTAIDGATTAETAAPVSAAGGARAAGPAQRGVPRGVRNHNPGNLRDSGDKWQGMTGVDDKGFVVFETAEAGMRAASINLANQMDSIKGPVTLRTVITKYAPASDNNDPEAYAATVAQRLGISPDEQIDLRDPAVNKAVLEQIVRVEQGDAFAAAPAAAAPTAAAPTAAAPAAPAATTAKPKTLREAQAARDAESSPLVAGAKAVVRGATARAPVEPGYWRTVADINAPGGDAARRDPESISDKWISERDMEPDPRVRARVDTLAYEGLTARANRQKAEINSVLAAGRPKEAAARAPQVVETKNQIAALNAARAKDTITTAMPRSAKPGDFPAAAGAKAAEQMVEGGNVPTTDGKQRALTAQLNQAAAKPTKVRITPEFTEIVAESYARGIISFEEANNILETGDVKKVDYKFDDMGMGTGVFWKPNGEHYFVNNSSWMDAAAVKEGAGKAGGLTPAVLQSKLENNLSGLATLFKAQEDQYDGGKKAPEILSLFNEQMTRHGAELQTKFGLQLLNPYTGRYDISLLTQGEYSILANALQQYNNEELETFLSMGAEGRSFVDYVGDQVVSSSAATSGWSAVKR